MLGGDIDRFIRVADYVVKLHFLCHTIDVEFVMILANETFDIVDYFVVNYVVPVCFAKK